MTAALRLHGLPRAVVGAALVRGFDERDDFDTLVDVQRGLARLEHLHNLLEQLAVDELRADLGRLHALLGERGEAEAARRLARAANARDAAVAPHPGGDFRVLFKSAGDALAPRSHER